MTVEQAIEIVNSAKESLKAVKTHDEFKSWQITAASILAKLNVDNLTITALTNLKSFSGYGIGALDKIKEAKESCSTILDGVISNFRHFGIEEEIVTETKSKNDSLSGIIINNHNSNTNNNANNNSQSTEVKQEVGQSTSITVDVQLKTIFESFTDELTPKQIRELNQIQASDLPPEEKKKNILSILGDKVIDFGIAVLANPEIWKMFT